MAKPESYKDLEAWMEHMEALIQGHFDEEPDLFARHVESRMGRHRG